MIPWVYLFRMANALLQIAAGSQAKFDLISATVSDGLIAAAILLAMSLGLILPKMVIDYAVDRFSRESPPL